MKEPNIGKKSLYFLQALREGLGQACMSEFMLDECGRILLNLKKRKNKIMFIGNGGSAAIANHQAIDYTNNGGFKAITFNESSFLTCMANDYGYDQVFARPIRTFAEEGDALIAISSSGKSRNILEGVKAAKEKKCCVITLSGFSHLNPLRQQGDINFYVPNNNYGLVEILHLSILHALLDSFMEKRMKKYEMNLRYFQKNHETV